MTKSNRNLKKAPARLDWRRIVFAIAAVVVLTSVALRIFGPPSPDAIKDRAIRAIETGDSRELCRLADSAELRTLHLTPENVDGFLRVTLWKDGYPKAAGQRKSDEPVDRAIWDINWQGFKPGPIANKVDIDVLYTPGIGWKLLLGELLRESCVATYGSPNGWAKYREMAPKYGIRGSRGTDGEYAFVQGQDAPQPLQ